MGYLMIGDCGCIEYHHTLQGRKIKDSVMTSRSEILKLEGLQRKL